MLDNSIGIGQCIPRYTAPKPLGAAIVPRFGRRSNPEPWTPWKLTIPASLAGTVEFLLLDPTLGKPTYGSRNTLVVRLLEAWLKTLPTEVKQVQGGALPLLRELNQ